MIKIIALADLHLGFQFHSVNDTKDQTDNYLAWLKKMIIEKEPDVLMMAGDIFDSGNPAADTLKEFYRFLVDVKKEREQMRILVIAGNHDSALKMEMTAPFTELVGVDIIGKVKRDETGEIDYNRLIFTVEKEDEIAHFVCVPYLREGSYDKVGSWRESVEEFYERAVCEAEKKRTTEKEAVIVMGHLYIVGATRKDNEDEVGGIDAVSLEGITDRVTLGVFGHIHRAQSIGKRKHIRYVGSCVPLSFDEEEYKHGAEYYEIEGGVLSKIERMECAPYHKLLTVSKEKKGIEEVIKEIRSLAPKKENGEPSIYLRAQYYMEEYSPSAKIRIDEAAADRNVLVCAYKFLSKETKESKEEIENLDDLMEKISPIEMLKERYRICHKGEMNEEVEELARLAIREAEE